MVAVKHLQIEAPAKLNLFLHVLGKREDGYHELYTWMQKISLCDSLELELRRSGAVEFSCDTKELTDDSNLAVRAAKLFLQQSVRLKGCGLKLHLEKRIPVAAGLGGGSSDAGTVLQVLNECAEGEFSEKEMIAMAKTLGADVPFFAIPAPAVLAEGIGEIMQPVESLMNYYFLLVNPGFFVSTAEIFRNLVLTRKKKNSKLPRLQQRNFTLDDMHNDLEEITCKLYPQVEKVKQSLQDVGAERVLMSGSGPTVFGVFEKKVFDNLDKQHILEQLSREYGEKVFWSKEHWGVAKR